MQQCGIGLGELGLELPPVFLPAGNDVGCVADNGMVNVAPGFNQTPAVIDGRSDLLVEIFGEAGRHTRSAVGLAELPFDIAVEIELIARIRT